MLTFPFGKRHTKAMWRVDMSRRVDQVWVIKAVLLSDENWDSSKDDNEAGADLEHISDMWSEVMLTMSKDRKRVIVSSRLCKQVDNNIITFIYLLFCLKLLFVYLSPNYCWHTISGVQRSD